MGASGCGSTAAGVRQAGGARQVYLSPEEVAVAARGAHVGEGASNVVPATLDKLEFLGAYCLARLAAPAVAEQGLTAVLSPHFVTEHAPAPGRELALRLRPQRLRVFGAAA